MEMRRSVAGLLILLTAVMAGCAGRQAAAPDPVPSGEELPAAQGPARLPGADSNAEVDSSPDSGTGDAGDVGASGEGSGTPAPVPAPPELVREEIPGGVRLGPFESAGQGGWLNPGVVWIHATAGGEHHSGMVALEGGGLEAGAEHDPEGIPYWDPWHFLLSPDGARAVHYAGRAGARTFINRETGAAREPEAPRFYGSNIFDSWSPDGAHFLVQSNRTDPVPGFYFLDRDGNPAGTFAEPGHFSHWGAWSPDGTRVAFLSVPMDLHYARSPEEWEEPPYGERMGVLDLRTGKATYFGLEGQTFFGTPVWSSDGARLAAVCGERTVVQNSHPFEEYETTRLREPRPCLVDLEAGTVAPVGDGRSGDVFLAVLGVTDEAVLIEYFDRGEGEWGYGWTPLGGGPLVELGGEHWQGAPQHVAGGRAALVSELLPNRLALFDQRGEAERILAEGTIDGLVASPDGRHLAFYHNRYLTVLEVPEE